MEESPLNKAFMLLEPGPVVLVTTVDGEQKNVMTISWHACLNFMPQFALVTGAWNYSYEALMKNRECVIAVPTADLAETVVRIGSCSGTDTDKFKTFGLTPVSAKSVKAPLIKECLANVECCVTDYIEKHNIFILDAVRAWTDVERKERRTFHAVGDGTFIVDGERLNYRKIMEAKLPFGV